MGPKGRHGVNNAEPTRWATGAILATLGREPGRLAVIELRGEEVRTISRACLARLIAGAERALAEAGVGRGDRVHLWAANSARWIAVAMATVEIGAVLVPLDAAASAAETRRVLDAEADALVVVEAHRAGALGAARP